MSTNKLAIVTVSSDSFLAGTIVLFHSFLTHNNWFTGDLIVIDGGLSEKSKDQLIDKFNAAIKPPGVKLDTQLDKLIKDFPLYSKSRSRFYSLEAFNLTGYEYVLFLDSDILCTGSLQELFYQQYEFAACADAVYYLGYIRHSKSFNPVEKSAKTLLFKDQFTDRIFNTGVMLISGKLTVSGLYQKLVNALTFKTFEHVQTGQTDTVVLNNELLGKVTWLDYKYNFYTTLSASVDGNTAPCLVHFIRKSKPWKKDASSNKWVMEWRNINKQLNEEG